MFSKDQKVCAMRCARLCARLLHSTATGRVSLPPVSFDIAAGTIATNVIVPNGNAKAIRLPTNVLEFAGRAKLPWAWRVVQFG